MTEARLRSEAPDILQGLLEVALCMSNATDPRELLERVLTEARRLVRAEAGSLYVMREQKLRFAACQNDRLPLPEITQKLVAKNVSVSSDSLAGFVGSTGRVVNVPDAYELTPGAPFRLNRDFDAATGYRTKSVLGLPLMCPDGQCVGVLELINRVGRLGDVEPFESDNVDGVISLAAMCGVSIQNFLLQDQLKKAHLDTIIRLVTAVEFRDEDTADHIRRLSDTSRIIARAMELGPVFVELIGPASTMHDIGKIGIPDAILLKAGPLTPEERLIVQGHVNIAGDIIGEPTNPLLAMALEIAMAHHERWDGTGYPNGLVGEEIPLSGRIVGLVDVFDALVSKRCYKDAFPIDKAMAIIKSEDGKHFAPSVVQAFFRVQDQVIALYRGQNSPEAA